MSTAVTIILSIIVGLGLVGGSYNTINNTLTSNGYNFDSSTVNSIYTFANDPTYQTYCNQNHDSLFDNYTDNIANDQKLKDDAVSFNALNPGAFVSSQSAILDDLVYEIPETPEEAYYAHWYKADNGYYIVIYDHGKEDYCYPLYASGNYEKYFIVCEAYIINASGKMIKQFLPAWTFGDGRYTTSAPYIDDNYILHYSAYTGYVGGERDYEIDLSSYLTEQPEEIIEVSEISISDDGYVTLPDGTVTYPATDGSVTYDGVKYYPTLDTTNVTPSELIDAYDDVAEKEITDAQNPTFDDTADTTFDDVNTKVDDTVSSYEGDMSEFLLDSKITQVFPFCLPFDFVRGIKLLSSTPSAPVFRIPFSVPSYGIDEYIVFDFGKYNQYFIVVRWVSTCLFVFSLIFVSTKIVKGAGS